MRECPSLVIDKASPIAQQLASNRFLDERRGSSPIQTVRVLVSYEALSELAPTNGRDLHGALENFDRFRSQVETAASRKFDRYGFEAQNYEGMPAIRLTTDDLI